VGPFPPQPADRLARGKGKEPRLNIQKAMVLVMTMPSLAFAAEPPNTPVPAKIVISDGPSPIVATATTVATSSAAHPFGLFPIYTDRAPHRTNYVPSGYMGDNDLALSGANVPTPHGKGPCLRVNYKASGPKGWAGVYWQNRRITGEIDPAVRDTICAARPSSLSGREGKKAASAYTISRGRHCRPVSRFGCRQHHQRPPHEGLERIFNRSGE